MSRDSPGRVISLDILTSIDWGSADMDPSPPEYRRWTTWTFFTCTSLEPFSIKRCRGDGDGICIRLGVGPVEPGYMGRRFLIHHTRLDMVGIMSRPARRRLPCSHRDNRYVLRSPHRILHLADKTQRTVSSVRKYVQSAGTPGGPLLINMVLGSHAFRDHIPIGIRLLGQQVSFKNSPVRIGDW